MSLDPTDDAEMTRFGITKMPAYRYHYRNWRYSNLEDALAQAKRDTASPSK